MPVFATFDQDMNNLNFTIYSEKESDVGNYLILIHISAKHVNGLITVADAYPILLVVSNLTTQYDPIWQTAL